MTRARCRGADSAGSLGRSAAAERFAVTRARPLNSAEIYQIRACEFSRSTEHGRLSRYPPAHGRRAPLTARRRAAGVHLRPRLRPANRDSLSAVRVRGRRAVVKDVGVRPPNDGKAAADDARPRPGQGAIPPEIGSQPPPIFVSCMYRSLLTCACTCILEYFHMHTTRPSHYNQPVIDYKYASLVTKLVTKLVMLQCRGGNMARNCGAASRYPFHLKVLLAYTQYQYSTDSDSEHRPRDAARPARHQQRLARPPRRVGCPLAPRVPLAPGR